MVWITHIPGCFGVLDRRFAYHEVEKERAAELRDMVQVKRIPLEQVLQEFQWWLHMQTSNAQHIASQMQEIEHFFNSPGHESRPPSGAA